MEYKKEHPIFAKHPDYLTEEEKAVMGLRPNELKEDDLPLYLRVRECVRRVIKEKYGTDYEALALELHSQMETTILDENLDLSKAFHKRTVAVNNDANRQGNLRAGMKKDGKYYVPYFRVYAPWEEYIVLQPIGLLKGIWNKKTRKRGTEVALTSNELRDDAITRIRMEWIETGHVDSIINEVNIAHPDLVPLKYEIKERLATTFSGRS